MYDELIKRLRIMADWVGISFLEESENVRTNLSEAADAIEKLSKQKWIPVTERLPDDGTYVLISFKRNMAVAYRWVGRWHVMCGGGWKTPILHGEQEPTHWMPLPEPPKEET